MKKAVLVVFVLSAALGLGWSVYDRIQQMSDKGDQGGGKRAAVPVEVADVERGSITWRRTYSGTLEANMRFVVAPKISGRIERLAVDLADEVERGQVVAELDDEEYVQAVAQAEADLAVARADLTEATSGLEIARRELQRNQTLQERGIASESQVDAAMAAKLAGEARLEVAKARVTRAEAQLETARIRLGYTRVTADWRGGSDRRVVAERYVDESDTVSANTPLLAIVELQPITGVFFVAERDYARLEVGQAVALKTDAYPREEFHGRIARISPVFRQSSRQARVELTVDNPDRRLKPGMFTRTTVVLATLEHALIVPERALTERDGRQGVFLVDQGARTVRWCPVTAGIREEGRVQVEGKGLDPDPEGGGRLRVVTLGQQLVDDGSPITIPDLSKRQSP